ncbi:MAG: hypothetical protein EOM80_12775 [Erysipelotrichia bacterium]|nr:hypothetical protein [Erysipelotrichia bacterium]
MSADDSRLAGFFPEAKTAPLYSGGSFQILPPPQFSQPDVSQFNSGVELNNQGLQAMRVNDFVLAVELFAQACARVPGEVGFWNNRLLAARRIKGREEEVVQIAGHVLMLNQNQHQAPYIAGLLYLNELKQPLAIPYLDYALRVSDDSTAATILATAFDQCGFVDDAFETLRKRAHRTPSDPYSLYLLGLQYLERRDYYAAIRALNSLRSNDDKGFAHDAWVRALYFDGQLDGLEHDCR